MQGPTPPTKPTPPTPPTMNRQTSGESTEAPPEKSQDAQTKPAAPLKEQQTNKAAQDKTVQDKAAQGKEGGEKTQKNTPLASYPGDSAAKTEVPTVQPVAAKATSGGMGLFSALLFVVALTAVLATWWRSKRKKKTLLAQSLQQDAPAEKGAAQNALEMIAALQNPATETKAKAALSSAKAPEPPTAAASPNKGVQGEGKAPQSTSTFDFRV
ncbi:hypothetical protein [Azotosporobacter soli]|uniref:hypothetical protein n=1 Tax=Azotosporobacter soli TaxID=3055040 RepID=UPI0031FF1455